MAEKLIFEIEIDGGKSVQTLSQLKEELKRLKSEFAAAKFGTPEFTQLGEVIKRVEKESKDLTNSFKEQNNIVPGSVAAIRNELKQFQIALENSIPGTKEFDLNLREVGKRKNELLELKQAIKATTGDLDSNIKAFAALGQGIAGAFTIATSATALFGEENEELAKSVQKAQLAISLLQGIESLAGSKDAANIVRRIALFGGYKKSIDDATKSQQANTAATEIGTNATKASVISFQALRAAIIATGIGLLITAVGELVANWEKVKAIFQTTFPIFQELGKWVDDTKQRFVGAFYAIGESIKPVGKLIYDYFTLPFRTAYSAAQIVFNILKNPLSIDTWKKGVGDFGKLFTDAKDQIVNDVKDIQNKSIDGFDYGTNLENQKQAAAQRKELIQQEIKDLEQSVQFIKSSSDKRLKIEEDIIQKKLSIAEKGSDDYNQLQVDLFNKQEEIKDKNVEDQKRRAEAREKEFAEFEKQIKEKYSQQSTIINVTAQVKVNQGENPAEIESIRDIQLTQNKIIELSERKTLYEKYQKDVTSIINELSSAEQELIQQNKQLVESLKVQEFNQDNSNLESYLSERENLINQSYLNELSALQNKNLSADELENQSKQLAENRDKQLAELKTDGLKKQLQNAKDYGQQTSDINQQILANDILNTENALNKKLELEKEYNNKKLELSKDLAAKQKELETEALNAVFSITTEFYQTQASNKIQSLEENLERETTLIENNVKNGVITQEQGEKQKKAAIQSAEKEKRKIIRETAVIEKTINVVKIAVDTVRAINAIQLQASILASNPATAALAAMAYAQIPVAIGSAAVQTGLILAQPLPPAQKGTIVGRTPSNSQLQPSGKPIMVMGGITPRFESGGVVDYAIVNSTDNLNYGEIFNNYISTSTYKSGGLVNNVETSQSQFINSANQRSSTTLNRFYSGGIPQLIDMGNGNYTLFESNTSTSTNVSSTQNPVINVGGRYIDDVLAVNSNNQPIARVNKNEAIMTAGAVAKFAPILSELNVLGGGARFPGYVSGGLVSNINNSNTSNSSSILDTSKLEQLLSEIKSEVSKPMKSYVLESEISEVQSRVQTIRERASF